MSVFVVLALAFMLAVAAKKRWLPGQHWLLQYRRLKKQEGDDATARVEVIVDKDAAPHVASRSTTGSCNSVGGSYADKAGARKSLLAKPPRHEGPASASAGSMEGSIRSALNELRSRQVVKNLCSQFEARVARKSITPVDDDEESCIRAAAASDGDDEYLLPAQSQQLRRDEPRIAPAPYGQRRNSNSSTSGTSANAPKPNNLHAFLRRYSSNLDKANLANALSSSNRSSTDCTSIEPAAVTPVIANAPVAPVTAPALEPVSAPMSASLTPASESTLTEIDLVDLQPPTADDEASNQCDSPVRLRPAAHISDGVEQDEPADPHDSGDWDVTPAKQQHPQSPEDTSSALDDKVPRAPVVTNSVARFQQFQLQIPANHARVAVSSSVAH